MKYFLFVLYLMFAASSVMANSEPEVAVADEIAITDINNTNTDLSVDANEQLENPVKLDKVDSKSGTTLNELVDALPTGFLIGVGAGYFPNRFDDTESSSYIFPGLMYLGDRFYFLGDRASYTFFRGEQLSFNVNARYRFSALDPKQDSELSTLNPRDGELEAGFGVNALTKIGYFTAKVNADVSGQSDGYLVDASWYLPFYKKGLLIMPSIGVTWFDSKMSNYYLGGVSQAESNPFIPAYDTGSNTSLNAMLIVGYRFNKHWFTAGSVLYSRYSNGAGNSPIMLRQYQTDVLATVGYMWD